MKGNDQTLKLHLAQFKKKIGGKYKFEVIKHTEDDEDVIVGNLFSPKKDDLIELYQVREFSKGLEFKVRNDRNNTKLRFFLQSFPGCCGIEVIKWIFISYEHRGKKLSYALLDMATELSKWFNYTVLTGTVSEEQPAMNFILKKRKEWKMVKSFNSNRTGNKIHMWLTEIKY